MFYSPLTRSRAYLTLTFAHALRASLRSYETPRASEGANERARESGSERALGYLRAKIHFAQERDAVRPSSCFMGRYEGAVKKACTSFARPGEKKRFPDTRGERGIRDKAQKRCPGKTGGRKSWPLIGKSKFVLRKLSAGGRCERTQERETADAA